MRICPQCGTQIAVSLLSCPSCHWLVHTETLKQLAQEAEQATQVQELAKALQAWRQALELLPSDSRQYDVVREKITALSQQVESGGSQGGAGLLSIPQSRSRWRMGPTVAGLCVLGVLAWKFKFLMIFLLTKAKLLVLGLGKVSTFFSMLLSVGVYWAAWGWKFALGVIGSIYIHEMGHVAALRRYGIKASAPMFIPGVGAFVQAKQHMVDPREDARVGLAGPWWGLVTALVAYSIFLITGSAVWASIAQVGAWITLFNLLPIWQLDGSRGFNALSRGQRWLIVLTIGLMWVATKEGLLSLLLLVAAIRALAHDGPIHGDSKALLQYVVLTVASSSMCLIHVPTPQ